MPVTPSDRPQSEVRHRARLTCVPRAMRSVAPALAATLLLAACTAAHGTVTKPAAAAPPPQLDSYVALGDSYTSAPQVPQQVGDPAGCQRSDHDYPALVAQHLGLKAGKAHDVSCSGARIADLSATQPTSNGVNPAQFAALAADTSLVTLGIGGNDVDFAGVLTRCVELDAPSTLIALIRDTTADAAPCRAFYTADGADRIQQKIQTASADLATALASIHQRAPHARVYVVGYPDLLPASDAATCARTLGLSPGDVSYLNDAEIQLNDMLKRQTAAAADAYVDTYTPSLGHDACADPASRWIEPLIPNAPAEPVHPNALGEQGMAAAVERAIAAR